MDADIIDIYILSLRHNLYDFTKSEHSEEYKCKCLLKFIEELKSITEKCQQFVDTSPKMKFNDFYRTN